MKSVERLVVVWGGRWGVVRGVMKVDSTDAKLVCQSDVPMVDCHIQYNTQRKEEGRKEGRKEGKKKESGSDSR